jgi:CysZ protein
MEGSMSRILELTSGFAYFFKGLRFMASRPRLLVLAAIPTAINLMILVVMVASFAHYYGDVYGWLSAHLGHLDIANPQAWYMHALDGLLWVADLLFQLLIILASLVILLLVSYGLSFIVAGPFNDMLSERVEIMLTGVEPPPFSFKKFIADLARTIRVESAKAALMVAIPLVLLVFMLIPGAGGVLYVGLTFVFGAWDLGFSYADLPMGRKAFPFKARIEFAKRNKWTLIGFGAYFAVPFFALIFAAPMVVGGTILYLDRSKR